MPGSDGQIARCDYSFGILGVALPSDIGEDATYEKVLAAGLICNASLAAMEADYSQLGHNADEDASAIGVSPAANFNNGFRAVLNWGDLSDTAGSPSTKPLADGAGKHQDTDGEQYMGIGYGYTLDDWIFAVNYGSTPRMIRTRTTTPARAATPSS